MRCAFVGGGAPGATAAAVFFALAVVAPFARAPGCALRPADGGAPGGFFCAAFFVVVVFFTFAPSRWVAADRGRWCRRRGTAAPTSSSSPTTGVTSDALRSDRYVDGGDSTAGVGGNSGAARTTSAAPARSTARNAPSRSRIRDAVSSRKAIADSQTATASPIGACPGPGTAGAAPAGTGRRCCGCCCCCCGPRLPGSGVRGVINAPGAAAGSGVRGAINAPGATRSGVRGAVNAPGAAGAGVRGRQSRIRRTSWAAAPSAPDA